MATLLALGNSVAAEKFELVGPGLEPRMGHSATMLVDGRILIEGGAVGDPYPQHCFRCRLEAELYDPILRSVVKIGGPRLSRKYHTATLLADGQVLIAGGWMGDQDSQTAELFNPGTGEFLDLGVMISARSRHSAELLGDGRVLLFGGTAKTAEIFDPESRTFTEFRLPVEASVYSLAVRVSSEQFLTVGGFPFTAKLLGPNGQLEAFAEEPIIGGMMDHSLTQVGNGEVLALGGLASPDEWRNYQAYPYIYLYPVGTRRAALLDWRRRTSQLLPPMNTERAGHRATLLMDGRVLVSGGVDWSEFPTGSTEVFELDTRMFSERPTMSYGRSEHTATLLRDGRALVFGGVQKGVAQAEFFVPGEKSPELDFYDDGWGGKVYPLSRWYPSISASHPALRGELLIVNVRGLFGRKIEPRISIGGKLAELVHFRQVSEEGLFELLVRVPIDAETGPEVGLWLMDLGRTSPALRIAIK